MIFVRKTESSQLHSSGNHAEQMVVSVSVKVKYHPLILARSGCSERVEDHWSGKSKLSS